MAKVVNIRGSLIEATARSLEAPMGRRGQATCRIDELEAITVAEWRRAAVLAGHRCGWKIATAVTPDKTVVCAIAVDRTIRTANLSAGLRRLSHSVLGARR